MVKDIVLVMNAVLAQLVDAGVPPHTQRSRRLPYSPLEQSLSG